MGRARGCGVDGAAERFIAVDFALYGAYWRHATDWRQISRKPAMHQSTLRTLAHRLHSRCLMGLAVCSALLLGACQSAATSGPVPVPTEATLQQQINTTIGQAPCTADAQCRTLGVGVNACGGPAAWRAWSTQNNPQVEALQSLVGQLATMQRQRQAQSGMVSNCRYLPDPGAVCQAQRCVLKSTADAAS